MVLYFYDFVCFWEKNCYRIERVCPPGTNRAKHQTLRIAVEKDWLFYYEWCHPGEWEANVQKPELPDGGV